MTRLSLCTLLSVLSMCCHGRADEFVIKRNQNIDDVSKQMMAAQYEKTMLQIGFEAGTDGQDWIVEPGVLVVTYSKATKKIERLAFVLQDERPKGHARTVSLEVAEFAPVTGEMKIKLPKRQKGDKINPSKKSVE